MFAKEKLFSAGGCRKSPKNITSQDGIEPQLCEDILRAQSFLSVLQVIIILHNSCGHIEFFLTEYFTTSPRVVHHEIRIT